jgi:glutamyl/glutaminyl-tRNA synthetase
MEINSLRTRIAPTPSGYLHIGNAFNFLLTRLIADAHEGHVLLRIDDADFERKRPEFVQDIFESLEWLGIKYEEGPLNSADFEANWSQRHRSDLYLQTLQELTHRAELFACTCTRKQLESSGKIAYPETCTSLHLPLNSSETAWRITVPQGTVIAVKDLLRGVVNVDLSELSGSFVVKQKNGEPAYQLTSLCDDVHYGINYIVRGEDLLLSSASQLYLAQKLGKSQFEAVDFVHHKLQHDTDGQKLSKSAGAVSLQYLRKHGMSAANVYALFCEQFLGLAGKPQSFAELTEIFTTETHPYTALLPE